MPDIFVHVSLQLTDPEDACVPLTTPDTGGEDWIALVVRSEAQQTNCSFDIKVVYGVKEEIYHYVC